jgi:hypothetical protein
MVGKTKYFTQVILPSTGEVLETFRNKMTAENWIYGKKQVYFEKLEIRMVEKPEEPKSVVTKKKL